MGKGDAMRRRLIPIPPRLLFAATLISDLAAVGAHEIVVHSRPRYEALTRVARCKVIR